MDINSVVNHVNLNFQWHFVNAEKLKYELVFDILDLKQSNRV